MTNATLMSRVKSINTRAETSSKQYLSLFVECVDLMRSPAGDWTCLAHLIGKAQKAEAYVLRQLAGKVIRGWTLRTDDTQPSGLRFMKKKGENQGFEADVIAVIAAHVEQGKSIHSDAIKALVKSESTPKPITEEDAAKRILALLNKHDTLSTGQVLLLVQNALAQAKLAKGEEEPNF